MGWRSTVWHCIMHASLVNFLNACCFFGMSPFYLIFILNLFYYSWVGEMHKNSNVIILLYICAKGNKFYSIGSFFFFWKLHTDYISVTVTSDLILVRCLFIPLIITDRVNLKILVSCPKLLFYAYSTNGQYDWHEGPHKALQSLKSAWFIHLKLFFDESLGLFFC